MSPRTRFLYGTFCSLVTLFLAREAQSQQPHHYVFFNRERHRIAEKSFLETPSIEGAQLKYSWKELEPEKNRYDFGSLRKDLAFLSARGKRLFVQVQDVSFDTTIVNVPEYLRNDSIYHGGADRQFEKTSRGSLLPTGWVARRWDPAVRERFHELLRALGAEFDGKIEGINLPETAVDFGEDPHLFPDGFAYDTYRDAILSNLKTLKTAFPRSVALIYANFMPGEWLPWEDRSYLRSIYLLARELHAGLGAPDLLPFRKGLVNNGYGFIRLCRDTLPTGVAVQEGNYSSINPETNRTVTIEELVRYATDSLHVRYLFWGTEEPAYTRTLIPFLEKIR